MTTGPEKVTRIGELVGSKYRIVRLLAQGGMGVVYEAQHAVVRRRFAVKFLRQDLAARRDILGRFQREAEAAGALESEHIAAAVDFGVAEDGAPYLVMEYLVGESLGMLLERAGRLAVGRAADLACQAGRGIDVAHASGIVHRDLKPQNLFVCRRQDGTDLLKVLDFGVAKLQSLDDMNAATRTGTVLGTVAYMSPEQARGDKIVDQRSDIYALGAILYEMVSGQKPHPGDSQNAILHHIATQPAVPLDSVQPGLPEGLVQIVGLALSVDAAARPASAEAFACSLAPFADRQVWPAPKLEESGPTRVELTSTQLAGGSTPATPSTPPLPSRAGPTFDDRAPAQTAPPPSRRRRSAFVAAAAVALAAVAVVAVVTERSKVPTRAPDMAVAGQPALQTPALRPASSSPGEAKSGPSAAGATSPPPVAPVAPGQTELIRAPLTTTVMDPAAPNAARTPRPLPAATERERSAASAARPHASARRLPVATDPGSVAAPPPAAAPAPRDKPPPAPITFDQRNPYE